MAIFTLAPQKVKLFGVKVKREVGEIPEPMDGCWYRKKGRGHLEVTP